MSLNTCEKTLILPLVRNRNLSDPHRYLANPNIRDHVYADKFFISKYFKIHPNIKFKEINFCDDLLRNRMANELFTEAVPVTLHEDDLNAMYFSVENRSPYLDRNLFDFCQKIPSKHMIKNGFAKSILREALLGIAPEYVLKNHRKVGFNAPIEKLVNFESDDFKDILLNDTWIYEFLDRNIVAKTLEMDVLDNEESKFLFNLFNSQVFISLNS